MHTKRVLTLAAVGLLMLAAQARGEPASVVVEAFLGEAAVLMIDGQRKVLEVGQSFAGVTLIATGAATATLDIDGRMKTVGLSQHVTTAYQKIEERVVTIPRDAKLQYRTNAIINGRGALVLVDTGANVIAINASQARALGINYSDDGIPSQVETASGVVAAHAVTLQSVNVGGLQVDNVPAVVVEGDYPATVLLGMSYLRHVKLQEQNGTLSLSKSQ